MIEYKLKFDVHNSSGSLWYEARMNDGHILKSKNMVGGFDAAFKDFLAQIKLYLENEHSAPNRIFIDAGYGSHITVRVHNNEDMVKMDRRISAIESRLNRREY